MDYKLNYKALSANGRSMFRAEMRRSNIADQTWRTWFRRGKIKDEFMGRKIALIINRLKKEK